MRSNRRSQLTTNSPVPRLGVVVILCMLLVLAAGCVNDAAAQDVMLVVAPPPVRIISKDDRARLDAVTDLKLRTKLTLKMMDERLATAQTHNSARDYNAMFDELGVFHGLMNDGLKFLKDKPQTTKVLDMFKRFEIGLRGFAPRLEAIRRDLPLTYEDYVRRLIIYLRDARTSAIEPQFADTVIPEDKPK